MEHVGHEAGAVYTAGLTVDVPQLEHESHVGQLEQEEPQVEQLEQAEPHTGRITTALVSVTGRAQVEQVPQLPHDPQLLHELQGLTPHDEQVEQAGAYEAHVEQPEL
jgi:hypothetical protein